MAKVSPVGPVGRTHNGPYTEIEMLTALCGLLELDEFQRAYAEAECVNGTMWKRNSHGVFATPDDIVSFGFLKMNQWMNRSPLPSLSEVMKKLNILNAFVASGGQIVGVAEGIRRLLGEIPTDDDYAPLVGQCLGGLRVWAVREDTDEVLVRHAGLFCVVSLRGVLVLPEYRWLMGDIHDPL